jgi:hypothetical protein
MEASCKRIKLFAHEGDEDSDDTERLPTEIYILPHKIQKRRFNVLLQKAHENHLPVTDTFCSSTVSHIVSDHETVQQTIKALHCELCDLSRQPEVIRSSWLSECIRAGHVLNVEASHRLPLGNSLAKAAQGEQSATTKSTESSKVQEYACQRVTLLDHHNQKFTKALGILEEFAELKDDEANHIRALAFRRAAATLACLPSQITRPSALDGLPDIGSHCQKIIEDILENGFSEEVEAVENDDWFRKMKLFTSVFGAGPATAKKWIKSGISSIDEAISNVNDLAKNDSRIAFGKSNHCDAKFSL